MPTTKTRPSKYKPHPMLRMEMAAKERVEEQSGKTWARLLGEVKKRSDKDGKAARAWLQKEYGLRPMDARWIEYEANHPTVNSSGEPEPLVDALYSGKHAALRPVHESVVDAMNALGDDVIVTACQTMVPVYRKHVFAEMRPVDDAVEVHLALGDAPAKGRLEKSDGRMPGDRLTHRVLVRSARDVDGEVRGWLATAYEQGAAKMARSTEFDVPADFSKALKASKPATATWATMTPAMQRDMVLWVTSAKQDDTRARRFATSISKLASGRKRVY